MALTINNVWRTLRAYNIRTAFSTTASDNRLNIYSGSMPVTADGFNPANYTGNLLVSFPSFTLTNDATTYPTSVIFNALPPNTVATGTGTAVWFAMFRNATPSVCIIGDVSDNAGSCILKISTLNIVTSDTISALSFTMKFQ